MLALLASMAVVLYLCLGSSWLKHRHVSWSLGRRAVDNAADPLRRTQPPAAAAPEEPWGLAPWPQHGQLVFAQALAGGRVGLDCLLTGADGDGSAGRPAHLVVALPDSPWLAAIERELLQQWLDLGDPVAVELSEDPAGSRVRVVCRRTTFLLDRQPA